MAKRTVCPHCAAVDSIDSDDRCDSCGGNFHLPPKIPKLPRRPTLKQYRTAVDVIFATIVWDQVDMAREALNEGGIKRPTMHNRIVWAMSELRDEDFMSEEISVQLEAVTEDILVRCAKLAARKTEVN